MLCISLRLVDLNNKKKTIPTKQLTLWAKKLYCIVWDWVLNTPLLNYVTNKREHHATKHLPQE